MKIPLLTLVRGKRITTFILISLWSVFYVSSQIVVESKATVENVNFAYLMEQVLITYDLVNTRFYEKFTVTLKVYNTKGEQIPAVSTTGDIGENISRDGKKRITWNIHNDLERLDDNIYVIVEAELNKVRIIEPISRPMGLVYSTLYPGYGGYRITRKKIHLAKGIAGYGLIGTSIMMRVKASSSYDSYKVETDLDKRDEYYQKVESQLLTSNLLLAGAGLVWISDYLTVLLAEDKVRKRNGSGPDISFRPTVYPEYSTPGFSMRITF